MSMECIVEMDSDIGLQKTKILAGSLAVNHGPLSYSASAKSASPPNFGGISELVNIIEALSMVLIFF